MLKLHSHSANMLTCLCGSSDGSRVLDAAKTGDVQAVVELIKKKPKLAHAQQWGKPASSNNFEYKCRF